MGWFSPTERRSKDKKRNGTKRDASDLTLPPRAPSRTRQAETDAVSLTICEEHGDGSNSAASQSELKALVLLTSIEDGTEKMPVSW